jgi:hypothetical protein
MSGLKLVCSGLCSAISKCVEYVVDAFVLMYARSYVRNLSIQLYLNVCNLYMLLFVNYVQFCPGTGVQLVQTIIKIRAIMKHGLSTTN